MRVDINPDVKPDLNLDLSRESIPFSDDSFDVVIADPPYVNFKPYCFVDEAVRIFETTRVLNYPALACLQNSSKRETVGLHRHIFKL